jgi:drug/metabolite transporter (DMT)-like permease
MRFIHRNISQVNGAQALFGAAFLFATTGALVREMGAMWGITAQIFIRSLLVVLILFVFSYFHRRPKIPREILPYAVILGVMSSSNMVLFTYGFERTTLSNTYFCSYATTIIVSFLLGTLVLKEKVPKIKTLAIILTIIGLGFYAPSLLAGATGIIYGVLAGFVSGTGGLVNKRVRKADRIAVMRIQYGMIAIFSLGLTLIMGTPFLRTISWPGTIATVVFALVLIGAGNLLLYGYRHIDINIGSVVLSSELVFGSLLGFLLYREVPTKIEFVGGGVIFLGSLAGGVDWRKLWPKSNLVTSLYS